MTAPQRLPHLGDRLFLGDGGLETTMIYGRGIELPHFASFLLLTDQAHSRALLDYYLTYLKLARDHDCGFTLDTPTWRANADWGQKLGYSTSQLAEVNEKAVRFAAEVREAEETESTPIAICGALGPRGDACHPSTAMSPAEAELGNRRQAAERGIAGGKDCDQDRSGREPARVAQLDRGHALVLGRGLSRAHWLALRSETLADAEKWIESQRTRSDGLVDRLGEYLQERAERP